MSAQVCGEFRDHGDGLSDGVYTDTEITQID